jgi:hypothetical protein
VFKIYSWNYYRKYIHKRYYAKMSWFINFSFVPEFTYKCTYMYCTYIIDICTIHAYTLIPSKKLQILKKLSLFLKTRYKINHIFAYLHKEFLVYICIHTCTYVYIYIMYIYMHIYIYIFFKGMRKYTFTNIYI